MPWGDEVSTARLPPAGHIGGLPCPIRCWDWATTEAALARPPNDAPESRMTQLIGMTQLIWNAAVGTSPRGQGIA
jgi:hypothetical protein